MKSVNFYRRIYYLGVSTWRPPLSTCYRYCHSRLLDRSYHWGLWEDKQ